MSEYNRTLLSKEQFESLKPQLLQAFSEFTPRSHFINDNKKVEKHNYDALDNTEQPSIVSYPTYHAPHQLKNIKTFDEVFDKTPQYELLNQKFQWVDNYVKERVDGVKNSFITFSTNITGAKIGVKHLHSLLNGDCCNVWSFAVPLYIADSDEEAGFWYNSREELFPPRYYVDYARIKQLDIKYTSFKLPKDGKILSVLFDGSRNPHYIDYTSHLYAFMVFDGITFKDNMKLGKRWITELL